jgi:hypothetical protein
VIFGLPATVHCGSLRMANDYCFVLALVCNGSVRGGTTGGM